MPMRRLMAMHRTGQARVVAWSGALLGLVIALGLAYVVAKDMHSRLDAAQRQALVLATGTERVLRFEFRNLERAMLGIAGDGRDLYRQVPEHAPALLGDAITGVVARHPELESIVVLDLRGNPVTAGRGDPGIAQWAVPGNRGAGSQLYVGPMERSGRGWALRLAIRMDGQHWLLTRLRTEELQGIVTDLDLGQHGVVAVVALVSGRATMLVACQHGAVHAGGEIAAPLPPDAVGRAVMLGAHSSADGDHLHIAAASAMVDYPLQVYAGLDRDDVLAPWWPFVAAAVAVYLLYWLGLGYLLHSLRRAGRRQARLLAELRAGDEELRLAHQVGGVGTWWMEADGERLHWSAQTMQMLELERSQMGVREFLQRVHSDDLPRVKQGLRDAWQGQHAFDITARVVLPRQGERWIAARGALVDEPGNRRMTGTVVDMSERVETQTLALNAQRQFRLIFEMNPLPCWLFDLESLRFIEVNPAAEQQYGYSREQFLRMRITDLNLPEENAAVIDSVRQPDPPGRATALVVMHRRSDGSLIDVRVHSSRLEIAGTQARLVLAENISEYMAYQRDLAYRASHDASTGLLTVPALAEALDRDAAAGTGYTVAHLQLRGLQLIGDTLGRDIGQDVLQRLCRQLQLHLEDQGRLAFQPAEDFVVAIADGRDAERLLQALSTMLAGPLRGRDSTHQIDAHIGVAHAAPGDGSRAEDVIGKAAQAAHAAREAGVPLLHFDCGIAARLGERLRLVGRLHEAIDRGEFELHYQPILHAVDASAAAFEALIRWRTPERGLVPPSEFIQLCEDTGLIVPLGRWAIRQAARDQRALADAGWPGVPIAINVSALQFLNTDVAADVIAACREFGLGHGALHVELTESSLMRDPEQALETMHALHRQGVCVSLDDFGTGFSSMSYLQHMPLDSIKIDRVFVTDVDSNARNASICRALLTLGHNLDLKVIAEGVERSEQLAWLAANGCDQVQGFLIGRPAPLAQVLDRLRDAA